MLGDRFDEVLLAARAGAEWAWAEIYRDLASPVMSYLRGKGARSPEDLTGDVFVQVVRSIGTFEGDERGFRSWVFTIARNRLLDVAKYERRHPAQASPPEALIHAAGTTGDPEGEASNALDVEQVRALISRLSPDQQDVLLLRLFGGLSLEEVAHALGKRVGAIKALQRRGLASLKRELSREGVSR